MKKRLYPAVLERGPKATFGAWFPDFPGCVAAGKSQEQAIERAENALAQAVDELFERGQPLPQPTPIERIVLPKGCDHPAYFIVGVDPPDPSERVNVYLPKSLIAVIERLLCGECARLNFRRNRNSGNGTKPPRSSRKNDRRSRRTRHGR